MIRITKTNNKVEITGHANYAPYGYDIVCSAVSTLTQTFIASVRHFTNDKLKYVTTGGEAFISYKNLSKDAQLLLNSFFYGLEMVANTYPEYIEINKE